jgi:hypothetical protein
MNGAPIGGGGGGGGRGRRGLQLQLIGMSATISNLGTLAEWLGAVSYDTAFRPVSLRHHVVVGRRVLRLPSSGAAAAAEEQGGHGGGHGGGGGSGGGGESFLRVHWVAVPKILRARRVNRRRRRRQRHPPLLPHAPRLSVPPAAGGAVRGRGLRE